MGPTQWVSPLVIVDKPNGDIRLCVTMCKPNEALCRTHHPYPSLLWRLSGGFWCCIVPLLGRYPRSDSLFISCWQVPPGAFEGNNYSSIRVDGCYCVSSAKQDLDEGVRDTQWWSYSRRVRLQWPLDKGAGISNKIRVWVGGVCPRKHRADCKRHFALCYTLRHGVMWLYRVTLVRTRDFLEFLNLDLRSVELD